MNITALGIDLAKNVFQLHGADQRGKKVLSKRLTREKFVEYMSNLKACVIGIEACGSAHYWARLFTSWGHTVKIMAPQFVKPYIRGSKNDVNDARGIAEAMTRPDMKFVPIKTIEQQEILLFHRARELAVKQKVAQANQIRGLLAEFGVIIPKGISHLDGMTKILEDNADKLTARSSQIFVRLHNQFKTFVEQVDHYDKEIEKLTKQDPLCKAIMEIEGVGPLTASAITATIGDAKSFKNGREVAAWLGLVPKQNSSGNKVRLGGITKRGDRYVRKLLINGGRTVVKNCENKTDSRNKWIADKKLRSGYNKASVAVANKNARIIWAILKTGECYRKAESVQPAVACSKK